MNGQSKSGPSGCGWRGPTERSRCRDAPADGRLLPQPAQVLELRPRPPFRLDLTAWALRRRAQNDIDRWDGHTYRRAIVVSGTACEVSVTQDGSAAQPRLEAVLSGSRVRRAAEAAMRSTLARLLGLDVDLCVFYTRAAHDGELDELTGRFRGMKPRRSRRTSNAC